MTALARAAFLFGPVAFALACAWSLAPAALPTGLSPEAMRVLGLTAWMAAWWVGECVPFAATSLLPLVVFPLGGVAGVKEVSAAYSDRFILLLMGGFFLALALERHGLHRRLALAVLARATGHPRRLLWGFLAVNAVASLWLSNTATTLMMLPIVGAVVHRFRVDGAPWADRFATAAVLAVAYGASVGGMGTPIGTPPNAILLGLLPKVAPAAPPIGFVSWMVGVLPIVVLLLAFIALHLERGVARLPADATGTGAEAVREERRALPPMAPGERRVALLFGATALAWITRSDLTVGDLHLVGWASALGLGKAVDDSTVAILAAVLAFALPAGGALGRERLLDWETAKGIPWGLLLLFGGGLALATGFERSGLSAFVGGGFAHLAGVPLPLLVLGVALAVTFLTEVTSNTATTTILLPVLAAAATQIEVPPLVLMLPATLSASCAFMLPVATAPNAIVFGTGWVTVPQMARAGAWINVVGALVITALSLLWTLPMLEAAP